MVFGEARFRSIFDTTGHGIAVLDLGGDFLEINPALREVFGYSGKELKGQSSTVLLAEAGSSSFPADVRSMAAGSISRSRGEHRLKRKDGTVAWARVSAVLIRDRSGKPDHILMMMEDVSEAGVLTE